MTLSNISGEVIPTFSRILLDPIKTTLFGSKMDFTPVIHNSTLSLRQRMISEQLLCFLHLIVNNYRLAC
jgi:hypothetical protein